MSTKLIVVNNPKRWPFDIPGVQLVSANDYLTDPSYPAQRNCRVYNLCRSYRYQTSGYYVSLLAEARGHRPVPKVATLQDLRYQSLFRIVSEDLDETVQKCLRHLQHSEFVLSLYFGRNIAMKYEPLARRLFNLFPIPLFRAWFERVGERWMLQNLAPISTQDIPEEHREFALSAAHDFFTSNPSKLRARKPARFHMAILVDPEEKTPPSDPRALQRFVQAAQALSIDAELIERDDYGQIAEYDALFIRQTTAVNNVTYRFARRAEAEGLVVIDDPTSIVRCTNKVYLTEMLTRHNIPSPRTEILHRKNRGEVLESIGLPMILKQPDSAFSLGVVKASTRAEYDRLSEQLLDKSELIIAQRFLPTDYDWRIGILDGKPLYACKYFMARGHWQIYNNDQRDTAGSAECGSWETLPVEVAPRRVVQTAVRAAAPIGDGLYGVDLKVIDKQPVVIEVNDNPSLDSGVEDQVLREFLYERIMENFLRRMENKRKA